MAFPNISDILTTTIENRSKKIADNVTNNNALLKRLQSKGKMRPFSGGNKIMQELSFAENSNAGWYTGYDILPTGVSDVISAAEFSIKQAAVPVVISGLEQLQNAGREQMIDLMEARMSVAESTLANLIVGGLYSDGTGSGGKEIDGLDAAIPLDPTTGTYGGINSANYTSGVAYFLNTNYIHYRPHSARNMVPLSPNRRYATNQDAEVQIIGWAGNMTCSGRMFQGRWDSNA